MSMATCQVLFRYCRCEHELHLFLHSGALSQVLARTKYQNDAQPLFSLKKKKKSIRLVVYIPLVVWNAINSQSEILHGCLSDIEV